MNITQISVTWAETCSLPEYSNVKPAVTLTAIVEEGDNPESVKLELLENARRTVRAEIDHALEMHDRPPKYYQGMLYQVVAARELKAFAVIPDDIDRPHGYSMLYGIGQHMTPHRAVEVAANLAARSEGYTIFECLDGDLDRLPKPEPDEPADVTAGAGPDWGDDEDEVWEDDEDGEYEEDDEDEEVDS